jgi:hypothetical protein
MLGLMLVDGLLLLLLEHLALVRVKLLLLLNFLVRESLLLHVLHVDILRMLLWWWHLLRMHGLLVLLLRWHHRLGLIVLLGQLTNLLSHRLSLVLLKGLLLRLHLHVAHGRLLIDIGAWLLCVESLLLNRVLRGMLVDLVLLQGVHWLLLHVMTLGSLLLSLLLR